MTNFESSEQDKDLRRYTDISWGALFLLIMTEGRIYVELICRVVTRNQIIESGRRILSVLVKK